VRIPRGLIPVLKKSRNVVYAKKAKKAYIKNWWSSNWPRTRAFLSKRQKIL
jgi:hypothetical protein